MNPIVIAEFGSSPAPDWDFARWCSMAALSGATHCKVQLFKAEHFPAAEQASKRPLEFPRDRLAEFVRTAHRYSLRVGASVFDDEAARLVAKQCDFIKLAAREQNNYRLNVLVYETKKIIYQSYTSLRGIGGLGGQGVPLYTISEYPTSMIRSLVWLARVVRFAEGDKWGWSSHTRSILDCVLAARFGASVIEKHFCMSPADLEGKHSLTPIEFKQMTDRIFK